MVRPLRLMALSLLGLLAVAGYFAMTVYPLGYGPVESALVAAAIFLAGLWELVLEDTTF